LIKSDAPHITLYDAQTRTRIKTSNKSFAATSTRFCSQNWCSTNC